MSVITLSPPQNSRPDDWRVGLNRLDPNWPLRDTPLRQWEIFLKDCRRFLDRGAAIQAVGLGWTGLDLFGCDPDAPYARVDRLGLLWLLHGRPLVLFNAEHAGIGFGRSVVQTYRRDDTTGRVLPWDIA
jgi:hypothetical protein